MTSKEAWLIEWARQWDKQNLKPPKALIVPICVGVSDQIPVGDKLS